jgi:hypothetical protein
MCPLLWEVVSSMVCDGGGRGTETGAGAGGSSMRVMRFTGVLVPRVEVEPPDRISLDMMHSCNTYVITGGGSSTIMASRAHHLSS